MKPLLEVRGLCAWYGLSQVLRGVNLSVGEGEVVALMGRNGMGKSSTINSISGMIARREGTIAMGGVDLLPLASYRIAQLGVGLVPEGRRCFANLTVFENLIAAARSGAWTLAGVYSLFPRLGERTSQNASTLSGGEQQMLAIGRALMTNPRLLVLDEATEGLAPVIRQEIWAAIRVLRDEGLSILLVDKTIRELLNVATHCVILEKGETCWQGTPGDLTTALTDRYLGV